MILLAATQAGARPPTSASAERHLAAALSQYVGGEYVDEHWRASFAALAMGECP